MKLATLSVLSLIALTSAAYSGTLQGPPDDARQLIHITTDATDINCDLFASVDKANALTGVVFACSNHPDQYTRYTLDQVKAGFSINKSELLGMGEARITLLTISAPNIDAVKGGDVNAHYIANGISGDYKDFGFTVGTTTAGSWSAATGNTEFDQMFLKAKTVFGKPIGIDCISISETPNQPQDCSSVL